MSKNPYPFAIPEFKAIRSHKIKFGKSHEAEIVCNVYNDTKSHYKLYAKDSEGKFDLIMDEWTVSDFFKHLRELLKTAEQVERNNQ